MYSDKWTHSRAATWGTAAQSALGVRSFPIQGLEKQKTYTHRDPDH